MPTYEYACNSCGEHLEIVQSFKDDPLSTCPACGGPLRKVFSPIGVVFKGSGFYKTDSRPTGGSKASAAAAGGGGDQAPSTASSASDGGGTSGASTGAASSSGSGGTGGGSSGGTSGSVAAAS